MELMLWKPLIDISIVDDFTKKKIREKLTFKSFKATQMLVNNDNISD